MIKPKPKLKPKPTVKFPVIAIKTDYRDDVRRISAGLNDKGQPEYARTLAAIAMIYSLDKDKIQVTYMDSALDIIGMKTTKELRFAFKELPKSKNCLRLTVTLKGEVRHDCKEDMYPDRKRGSPVLGKKHEETEILFTYDTYVWLMDKIILTYLAEHGGTTCKGCHAFCVQNRRTCGKRNICYVLLYHMCIHHDIIPNDGTPMTARSILHGDWLDNDEIDFYLSLFTFDPKTPRARVPDIIDNLILKDVLKLAICMGHLDEKTVKGAGHISEYSANSFGRNYMQCLSPPRGKSSLAKNS